MARYHVFLFPFFAAFILALQHGPTSLSQQIFPRADYCPWTTIIKPPACLLSEVDESKFPADAREDGAGPGWQSPGICVGHFCIYTNPGFAGGRGIAVISTQSDVEKLKRLGVSNRHLSAAEQPYRVGEVQSKGLGLLAVRKLRRGDTIMEATPAVIVHKDFVEQIPPHDQYPLLETAVAQLPTRIREAFLSQMGHFGGHKISDILMTNSFQLDLGGENGFHYGSFPDVSRFNHDCRPNVAFYINKNLTHVTTVVRDIRKGEELSIAYLDPFDSRALRQERAQNAWGFNCGCLQCSLPTPLADRSDERLQEIAQIESQLSDFKAKVTPKLVQQVLRLYKDEGLDSKLAGVYTLAALNYNMLGDDKSARKYAWLASEALDIENPPGSRDAIAMENLVTNPRSHFTWRSRLST